MYYTQYVLPALEAYQVDRTIPESTDTFVAQQSDAYQECVFTILCATVTEADELVKELKESEWKYQMNVQLAPMHEGIARVSGTITCRRLLPMSSGLSLRDTDDDTASSYTVTLI